MCKGIENYSAVLSGRAPGSMPTTLLDYFPKDFLLFVDESHVTLPQVRAMYGGDYARKKTLVEYGFRLPSAFDNRPPQVRGGGEQAEPDDLRLGHPPDRMSRPTAPRWPQQVIRPTGLLDPPISVRPVEGQVTDLLGEINARTARGERVLVTTLTKKMAEDLTDYLTDQGVKVKYMHHEVDTFERMELIRDLRLGTIDVIVGHQPAAGGPGPARGSAWWAILDADKEGFLRSETSLIQTIGRAAPQRRRPGDHVRRYRHRQYGAGHHRDRAPPRHPDGLQRGPWHRAPDHRQGDPGLHRDQRQGRECQSRHPARMGKKEREAAIERLTREMKEAAKLLEFEHAAFLRDQIDRLRRGREPHRGLGRRGRAPRKPCTDTEKGTKTFWQTIRSSSKAPGSTT